MWTPNQSKGIQHGDSGTVWSIAIYRVDGLSVFGPTLNQINIIILRLPRTNVIKLVGWPKHFLWLAIR